MRLEPIRTIYAANLTPEQWECLAFGPRTNLAWHDLRAALLSIAGVSSIERTGNAAEPYITLMLEAENDTPAAHAAITAAIAAATRQEPRP